MTTAAEHFAAKLRFETDPSDVRAAFDRGDRFVLVDSRGEAAWAQGRVVGAVHISEVEVPLDMPIVVYCWGPGCNGSTRAALEFAKLGHQVKEMIGGYEYWAREGLPTENSHGPIDRAVDVLTAPADAITCDC